MGDDVTIDKPPNAFRILLLGDSSPVGLGLDSYKLTFGELVRYQLELKLEDSISVELVNAAVSGYTSEQIAAFLKLRGWDYQPDVVILYCGNNDASISGAYSDLELMETQRLKPLRRALSRDPDEMVTGRPLKVRVSPERYGENVTSIAKQCQRHNCPLIILKPPVPRLWPAGLQCKLFRHITGEDGQVIFPDAMVRIVGRELKYCIDRELFADIYGQGDKFTQSVYRSAYDDSLKPKDAVAYYHRLLQSDSTIPVLRNNLGVSLWQAGDYVSANRQLRAARDMFVQQIGFFPTIDQISAGSPFLFNMGINLLSMDTANSLAHEYLDSALQADYFSLRIKRAYLDKLDDVATGDNIYLITLDDVFAQNGGERLFIDHCHPTECGHGLIAREIVRVLSDIILR
jgi:lysophospholipase L1-like esterase